MTVQNAIRQLAVGGLTARFEEAWRVGGFPGAEESRLFVDVPLGPAPGFCQHAEEDFRKTETAVAIQVILAFLEHLSCLQREVAALFYPLGDHELEMEVRGRDQVAGLPITKRINSVEIRECLAEPIQQIIESVKLILEKCPPELAADLVERGMVLVGGGALIKGFDKFLIKECGLPVIIAQNPLLAVCLGTGKALEYLDRFKKKKSFIQ